MMNTRNSGWQPPRRKSVSPPPGKPNRELPEYRNDQLLPVTLSHARALYRVLATTRRRAIAVAFTRIACRGDKGRPRRAGLLILHELVRTKQSEYLHRFTSIVQKQMLNTAQKSELPEWFKKELECGQAPQKLIEEADRQQLRVGRESQKGILLQGILSLCRTNLQQRQTTEAKLAEFNNLSESVVSGQAGLRQINSWYRNNVTKMSPQMRRLKPLIVRCQELTVQAEEAQTLVNSKTTSRFAVNDKRNSEELTKSIAELKSGLDKQITTITGLATNRRFSSLKVENERGRFPQLRQLVELIVELMEQYPQPGEMLTVEQLATSINETTKKLRQIETAEIEKIELSIDRFRKKLSNSENFLMRQVQTLVNYTDLLSTKLTVNPQEKLLKASMTEGLQSKLIKTEQQLVFAQQEIDKLKDQFNQQRIQYQEEKVYQSAIYKQQVEELKGQLEEISKQVRRENERLDSLETAAAERQQTEQPRRKMLVTAWPKSTVAENGFAEDISKSEYVRTPPLMHTDSKTYYEPIDPNKQLPPLQKQLRDTVVVQTLIHEAQPPTSAASIGQEELERSRRRLMNELEQSQRQIERLREIVAKYDESFKGYQQNTDQYRNMVQQLKEKLLEADRLDQQRAIEDVENMDDEAATSRLTIQDLEAGKRIMELETKLSEERERLQALEDRLGAQIIEMQDRISKQQMQKYQLELKCERFESEFARLAEQNRQVSIVLSKRDSFGNRTPNIRSKDLIGPTDSLFTFSQSGDSPLPMISPNGQFMRARTSGGRTSDEGIKKVKEATNIISMDAESVISLGYKPIKGNEVEVLHPSGSPPLQSQADNINEEQQRSVDSEPNPNHPSVTISEAKDVGSSISVRPQLRKAESHSLEVQFYENNIINKRNESQQDSVQLARCKAKIQEYEVIIQRLSQQLEHKQSEIREVMKESSVNDLAVSGVYHKPRESCEQCLNNTELMYDLESRARELELHCIKSQVTIDRLQQELASMERRLNHNAMVQEKLVKQYKRKCLEVKNLAALSDTLCKQEARLCRHIPNLEELKTQLRDSISQDEAVTDNQLPSPVTQAEILNLVRAEDVEIPVQLTSDMRRICNIIASEIVDLFNKYSAKLNAKQQQRILERYLIAMDKNKPKDAVQHLVAFIEQAISKLPDRTPTTDRKNSTLQLSNSSVREIKQKFIEVVGWQDLLPAIKFYLSSPNSHSLAQVKKILRLE